MQWESMAMLAGALSALVGVPLMVITMYLKALREHQTTTSVELTRRIEAMEASIRDLLRSTGSFEREYATKEEWVRESMLARRRLEQLTEMVTRIEAELETGQGVAAELGRATAALVEMLRAWSARWPAPAGAAPPDDDRDEFIHEENGD